jgi:hypothetical protein
VQLPSAPTHITPQILKGILQEYKIHHAEITLREDVTVDEMIDIIESTDKIGMQVAQPARGSSTRRYCRGRAGAAPSPGTEPLPLAPASLHPVRVPPPPPPPRTKWTRRVPHPVLIGHAASLTPY